jgi:hypothetical protein
LALLPFGCRGLRLWYCLLLPSFVLLLLLLLLDVLLLLLLLLLPLDVLLLLLSALSVLLSLLLPLDLLLLPLLLLGVLLLPLLPLGVLLLLPLLPLDVLLLLLPLLSWRHILPLGCCGRRALWFNADRRLNTPDLAHIHDANRRTRSRRTLAHLLDRSGWKRATGALS